MDRREHEAQRAGRLTSSMAAGLMGSIKARNRVLDLIRNPRPFYDVGPNTPEPLAWGSRYEAQCLATFWDRHPEFVVEDPRFLRYHDPSDSLLYRYLGDSPDRMIRLAGSRREEGYIAAVEAKCPYQQEIHYRYLGRGTVPDEYKPQCFFHMMVTGTDRCAFLSFDPRMENPESRYVEIWVSVTDDRSYYEEMVRRTNELLEILDMGEVFSTPPTTADFLRGNF